MSIINRLGWQPSDSHFCRLMAKKPARAHHQLGHCLDPRTQPLSSLCRWGVPQLPRLRMGRLLMTDQAGGSEPQAWRVLWTMAQLRIAWATPTRPLRSGSARHLAARSAVIVRGGPGGSPTKLRTMAHLPVGWATPIQPMRSGFAGRPVNPCRLEPRALPLAMTRSASRRPGGPGAAPRPRPCL